MSLFVLNKRQIAIDRRITIGPRSCELIYRTPIHENITEKSMSSSRYPRMIFAGNSLLLQSRWEVDPFFGSFPIHRFICHAFQEIDMRFAFSREEKDLLSKNYPVNICQMNSEKILSVLGYWCCIFGLVVMLKIPFMPTIEFTYSAGGPLLIMSSPISWKRTFFVCYPVPGESSEHWIAIWSAEFSLNDAIIETPRLKDFKWAETLSEKTDKSLILLRCFLGNTWPQSWYCWIARGGRIMNSRENQQVCSGWLLYSPETGDSYDLVRTQC
jgi:hypothetical protein